MMMTVYARLVKVFYTFDHTFQHTAWRASSNGPPGASTSNARRRLDQARALRPSRAFAIALDPCKHHVVFCSRKVYLKLSKLHTLSIPKSSSHNISEHYNKQ